MGLHKGFDRQFVLLGGAVKKEGGALDLTRGEIGFFNTEAPLTQDGVPAISSFKGISTDTLIEIRYRESDDFSVSRSRSSKTYKSFPFKLENVQELRVSAPKITEATVDELIVGWNGIENSTALKFRRGESKNATIELSGEAIGMLGYPYNTVQVPMFFDAGSRFVDECEEADFCTELECGKIVESAIDVLKDFKLRGGVPVTNYLEISPIRSCAQTEVETEYKFYSLTLCDTGDDSARSLVRQQYPGVHIERVNRTGAISTYELLQSASSPAPAAFKQTLPSIIKGCKDCPQGYTATEGGLVYAIAIEDDGVDKTSVVEGLPNAVAGSAVKADGQEFGVGFYTVVLTKKLTPAEIKTFVDANVTATIDFVSTVEALCTNSTVTTATWVVGTSLKLSQRDFIIDLPDTDCNGLVNRLEELKTAYPTLTIALEGTTGGCQTRYKTSVKTNLRGTVCDPIFLDYYKAETPLPYDNRHWRPVAPVAPSPEENCLCGFTLKGKLMQIMPTECVIDDIAYVEDSVKIKFSGGWISDIREGIGRIEDDPFHVEYKSYASKRTHMGYNLRNFEKQARAHFSGDVNNCWGNVEKFIRGVQTNINYEAQYIDYAIKIRREQSSQGMGQRHNSYSIYHIQVEVGRQAEIEAILNSLAAQAGIKGVKAFGETPA